MALNDKEITILAINEARKLSLEAGHKPIIFLINPRVSDTLSEEIKDLK